MFKQFHDSRLNSSLVLGDEESGMLTRLDQSDYFKFIWAHSDGLHLSIDGMEEELVRDQMICLTPIKSIEEYSGHFKMLFFNREFYCIHENDREVSCEGLLFWGSSHLPVLNLEGEERRRLEDLFSVFIDELDTRDEIQGEMLRMLLKRLIIICTRLAKRQLLPEGLADHQIEIIRKFNILVEKNFRKYHKVSDYAKMLNKSPKTLSNIFASCHQKSPLEIIHERIAMEGKRLLLTSDKISKEIAFELGFEDQSHFSRFFKKETGLSPTAFKKREAPT